MSRFSKGGSKPAAKSGGKKKMVKLFDIRKVTVNRDGEEKVVAKVQFPKNVEIFVDGEAVDLGEYNSLFLKTKDEVLENLETAVQKFGLSEEYAQKQVDYIEEKNISSIAEILVKE